jgi:hypothetical protein
LNYQAPNTTDDAYDNRRDQLEQRENIRARPGIGKWLHGVVVTQSVVATKAWFFWVVVVGTICCKLHRAEKPQFTAALTHSAVAIHRYHQRYRRCPQLNWVCGKNLRCVYIKDRSICIKTLFHIQVAEDSKGVAGRAWHTRDTITLRQASNCSCNCNRNNNKFER